MSELVADCPRCGAQKMTLDMVSENYIGERYDWQKWYEAFCICRGCNKATIFVLSQKEYSHKEILEKQKLRDFPLAINKLMDVETFINIGDVNSVEPPEHIPKDIEAIFIEGAKCKAIGCNNAAGTMFRLCVDLATAALLPANSEEPSYKIRRDLGLRLPWLFANNRLPQDLHDLSTCIKDDGNDAAHRGNLSEAETEDLLDFTTVLLERLYTEPERIKIAQARRDSRKTGS